MKNLVLLFFLLCVLIACQDQPNSDFYQNDTTESPSQTRQQLNQPTSSDKSGKEQRKIIKTAAIKFQVKDLNASTKVIEMLTQKYNGFVSNMNQTNSNYSLNNQIAIRVAVDRFDQFLAEIKKQSIFTNYIRIDAQDVTEEFVDITSRLKTKKEARDRYVEILRNKAKTVKDVLDAEDKIRVLQEEIESKEGRLKYLQNKTSMSTINVEIYQEVEFAKEPTIYKKSFLDKVSEGFVNGWNGILNLVIGLIYIWPMLFIFSILFFFRKRISKRIKER